MSAAPSSPQEGRDTRELRDADGLTGPDAEHVALAEPDESPEKLPMNTWVTLGLFAAFVVLFGTCASTFMFN